MIDKLQANVKKLIEEKKVLVEEISNLKAELDVRDNKVFVLTKKIKKCLRANLLLKRRIISLTGGKEGEEQEKNEQGMETESMEEFIPKSISPIRRLRGAEDSLKLDVSEKDNIASATEMLLSPKLVPTASYQNLTNEKKVVDPTQSLNKVVELQVPQQNLNNLFTISGLGITTLISSPNLLGLNTRRVLKLPLNKDELNLGLAESANTAVPQLGLMRNSPYMGRDGHGPQSLTGLPMTVTVTPAKTPPSAIFRRMNSEMIVRPGLGGDQQRAPSECGTPKILPVPALLSRIQTSNDQKLKNAASSLMLLCSPAVQVKQSQSSQALNSELMSNEAPRDNQKVFRFPITEASIEEELHPRQPTSRPTSDQKIRVSHAVDQPDCYTPQPQSLNGITIRPESSRKELQAADGGVKAGIKEKSLIEEFIVVGIESEEIRECLGAGMFLGKMIKAEPRIVYRWPPCPEEAAGNDVGSQMPNFLFPFGFFIKDISGGELDMNTKESNGPPTSPDRSRANFDGFNHNLINQLTQEYIFKDQIGSERWRSFFLSFNSEETLTLDRGIVHPVLRSANPNMYYTYYCVITEELVAIEGERFVSCPRVYLLKSMYPFRELFGDLLHSIVDDRRAKRLESIAAVENDTKTQLVSDKLSKELIRMSSKEDAWEDIKASLESLSKKTAVPLPGQVLSGVMQRRNLTFHIPAEKELKLQNMIENAMELLPLFSFSDYLFVLASVLRERTVIFVSEERRTLSMAVEYFSNIIKPLSWPFPVIYSLPDNCLEILASPVPLIAGILQSAEKTINEIIPEYAAATREAVFVLIDQKYVLADKATVNSTRMPRLSKTLVPLHDSIKPLFHSASSNTISYSPKSNDFARKSNSKLTFKNPLNQSNHLISKRLENQHWHEIANYLEGLEKAFSEAFDVGRDFRGDKEAAEKQINDRLGPKDAQFLSVFLSTQTFAYYLQQCTINSMRYIEQGEYLISKFDKGRKEVEEIDHDKEEY